MKYFVYKITNLLNKRYYIGKHSSNDIQNDKYFGSGKIINLAIKKYGKQNFKKQILYQFDDQITAFNKQKQLLSQNILKDVLCYNISTGGHGSFSHRIGKVSIRNENGIIYLISVTEYNKLIHNHANKNMAICLDKNSGIIKSVSKQERNLNPERYESINKNYAIYKNIQTGKNQRLDITTTIDINKYQHVNLGFLIVKVNDKFERISINDDRYISGQLKSKDANCVRCYDKQGVFHIFDINSTQWKSREFAGLNKNMIWCYDPISFKSQMVRNIESIPNGYKIGRGKQYNNNHKGNKFMNKDNIRKSVKTEDIEKYLLQGWKFGLKDK